MHQPFELLDSVELTHPIKEEININYIHACYMICYKLKKSLHSFFLPTFDNKINPYETDYQNQNHFKAK